MENEDNSIKSTVLKQIDSRDCVTETPEKTICGEGLNEMENESKNQIKSLLVEDEGDCDQTLNDDDVAEFHAVMNSILEMLDSKIRIRNDAIQSDDNCSATTSDQPVYVRVSDDIGRDDDGFIDFDNINP